MRKMVEVNIELFNGTLLRGFISLFHTERLSDILNNSKRFVAVSEWGDGTNTQIINKEAIMVINERYLENS